MDQILEILINNTERILDQQDKMADKIHDIDKTLIRLTATVEKHEQRSTTLEKIQNDCRTKCEAEISAAEQIALSAEAALNTIKSWFKFIMILLATIAAIVGFISGVAQIYSTWFIDSVEVTVPNVMAK